MLKRFFFYCVTQVDGGMGGSDHLGQVKGKNYDRGWEGHPTH